MSKIKCPCCNGTGEIEQDAPVYLSPMQLKIYNIVRKRNGILPSDLVNRVYATDPDGGPEFAQISVRVAIVKANARLAAAGERIAGGRTQFYKLIHDVV